MNEHYQQHRKLAGLTPRRPRKESTKRPKKRKNESKGKTRQQKKLKSHLRDSPAKQIAKALLDSRMDGTFTMATIQKEWIKNYGNHHRQIWTDAHVYALLSLVDAGIFSTLQGDKYHFKWESSEQMQCQLKPLCRVLH